MDPTGSADAILNPGIVGLVGIVAVVVQIGKPFLKRIVTRPTYQDSVLQCIAVVLGVALVVVQDGVALSDGASVVKALSLGVSVGLGAIGGYHVVTPSPGRPAQDVARARQTLAERAPDLPLQPAA